MKALYDSLVRTLVPIIVGAVLGWFVSINVPLDPEFELALTVAITGAFQGLYYTAVRLFETYVSPKFGVLLGLAKTPKYTPKSDVVATRNEGL